MKKYLLFLLLMFFLDGARAQVVNSCDGNYSAKITGHGEMRIDRDGVKIGLIGIDHDIAGGVFASNGGRLVVYGLPKKIDLRSPQARFLSIYTLKPRLRMVMERTYGGGIYEVAIGSDQKSIFVSSRFGFDIIDAKTMKIKSFDPMSEPKFSRQQCKSS